MAHCCLWQRPQHPLDILIPLWLFFPFSLHKEQTQTYAEETQLRLRRKHSRGVNQQCSNGMGCAEVVELPCHQMGDARNHPDFPADSGSSSMLGIPEMALLFRDCSSELCPQDGCPLSHALQSPKCKAYGVNLSDDIFLCHCQDDLTYQRTSGEVESSSKS